MRALWSAWLDWWAGNQVDQLSLWGWKILYWARVGKLLQFFAGLTIVLDIIGPARLRAAGERLAPTRTKFRSYVTSLAKRHAGVARISVLVIVALAVLAMVQFAEGPNSVKGLIPAWAKSAMAVWCAVAFLAFMGFRVGDKKGKLPSGGASLAAALFVAPAFIALVLLVVAIALPLLLLLYLLVVSLRLVALLLDRDNPGHALRWIAAILFIVGFHFDLLAS